MKTFLKEMAELMKKHGVYFRYSGNCYDCMSETYDLCKDTTEYPDESYREILPKKLFDQGKSTVEIVYHDDIPLELHDLEVEYRQHPLM